MKHRIAEIDQWFTPPLYRDIDEAALSRFNARVLVPLPSKEARIDILRRAMKGVVIDMSDADWLSVSERAGKYSGRDLMSVCR